MDSKQLALIYQFGSPEKIQEIKDLIQNLQDEVDHKILDQAGKRTLTQTEIDFLKTRRPLKRARVIIEEIPDSPPPKDDDLPPPPVLQIQPPPIGYSTCGLEHRLAMLDINR